MTHRKKLLARADALSVEVTIDHALGNYEMWSPPGRIFTATGCHVAVLGSAGPGAWKADDVYTELLQMLDSGLDSCPCAGDCDVCTSAERAER